jgi:hypothetical protein
MRQRKIKISELLEMIKAGKEQKFCANYFRVSEAAISKTLKRIAPLPESLNKLTPKEQKFCLAVAEGKSRINAALEAYDVKDRESAKALQNQLMQKDDIKIAVNELLQIFGLTKGYRINKIKQLVDHPDPNISLKSLDMSWKLDGSYAPEKHLNANFDYNASTKRIRELEAEEAELLRQLEELEGKGR